MQKAKLLCLLLTLSAFASGTVGVVKAGGYSYGHEVGQDIQDNPKARSNLDRGLAYFNQGQFQRAIECFDKAISLDSGYRAAYCNRGAAYHQLHQFESAISDYSKAISLGPIAGLYQGRGLEYLCLKDYKRAIENYDQAISLDPSVAYAHEQREYAYKMLKESEAAATPSSPLNNGAQTDSPGNGPRQIGGSQAQGQGSGRSEAGGMTPSSMAAQLDKLDQQMFDPKTSVTQQGKLIDQSKELQNQALANGWIPVREPNGWVLNPIKKEQITTVPVTSQPRYASVGASQPIRTASSAPVSSSWTNPYGGSSPNMVPAQAAAQAVNPVAQLQSIIQNGAGSPSPTPTPSPSPAADNWINPYGNNSNLSSQQPQPHSDTQVTNSGDVTYQIVGQGDSSITIKFTNHNSNKRHGVNVHIAFKKKSGPDSTGDYIGLSPDSSVEKKFTLGVTDDQITDITPGPITVD